MAIGTWTCTAGAEGEETVAKSIRVKGHKLVGYTYTGCRSTYVHAVCECGWVSDTWTESREAARWSHDGHKLSILKGWEP